MAYLSPHKASKLKPLTTQQKKKTKLEQKNEYQLSILIESAKFLKIVKLTYISKHKNYHKKWLLVTAFVNLKKCTNHLKYAEVA